MNGMELCAGVGALGVGTARAIPGYRTVVAAEIEAFAVAVLIARQKDGSLPSFPVWDDLKTFDGRPWRGVVDIVVAGFPCQDISLAGRGAGISGERSGLWFDVLRIIREVRPRFIFLENVAALTFRGMDTVLAGLAEVGADAEWGCLRASDVGAPHRRDRWWCLAWDRERVADDHRRRCGQRSNESQSEPAGRAAPRELESSRSNGHGAVVADSECPERWALDVGRGHRSEGLNCPGQTAGRSGVGSEAHDTPAVADIAGIGWREGWPESERQHGRAAHGGYRHDTASLGHGIGVGGERRRGDGDLESPSGGPQGPWDQRERDGRAADHSGSGDDGQALANRRGQRGLVSATGRHPGQQDARPASDSLHGIPEWPPLPDDTDGWRSVLASYPWLAPALPKLPVRGVADVGTGGDWPDVPWAPCDCNRSDRLRSLGNAVVPQQAEAALRLLWKRAFNEDL